MKKIFVFVAGFIFVSLGIEAFLKLSRITPPTLKYYNKTYGSLNRANIDYFKSVEGLYIGSTNYDGRFRESYPKRKSDKKTLRIMLMGDSFVEGIDVFSHNHFAQYLENLLSKRLNRKVEVLNFGRGNCLLAPSSYYFTSYVSHEYDADIVLYFTEYRDIFYPSTTMSYPSTYYSFDSNKKLVPFFSWQSTPEYKLHTKLISNPILKHYESSAYFRLLYRAMARVKISGLSYLTFGKFSGEKAPEQSYATSSASEEPLSDVTKKIYDSLASYPGGQTIFVVRDKPMPAPCIKKYFAEKAYENIHLSDTFNDFYIKNTNINAYYFKASAAYGGHWNNQGHEAVGYFLTNRLARDLEKYKMPNYER